MRKTNHHGGCVRTWVDRSSSFLSLTEHKSDTHKKERAMPQGLLGSGVFACTYVLRAIGQRGCVPTCPGSIRSVRPGHSTETATKAALREATGSTCFQWTAPFFRRARVNSRGCPLHRACPPTLLLHGGTEACCPWVSHLVHSLGGMPQTWPVRIILHPRSGMGSWFSEMC